MHLKPDQAPISISAEAKRWVARFTNLKGFFFGRFRLSVAVQRRKRNRARNIAQAANSSLPRKADDPLSKALALPPKSRGNSGIPNLYFKFMPRPRFGVRGINLARHEICGYSGSQNSCVRGLGTHVIGIRKYEGIRTRRSIQH